MELKYNDIFFHFNLWHWGESVDIVKDDGTAIVCVKFDEKTFPKTGYICDLSVIVTERRKGLGQKMMKYALKCCEDHGVTFARLHVDAKNIWLREWYERLGFKELSRDENEVEMIKEL
jgi:ribosomal protein S18 acetylase RimI-like enzyme